MLIIDINHDFYIINSKNQWNFHFDNIDEYINLFNDFMLNLNIKNYIETKYDEKKSYYTEIIIEFDNIKFIFYDINFHINSKNKKDHIFLMFDILEGNIYINTINKKIHDKKKNLEVIFDIINYYKKILKLDIFIIEDNSYFSINNQKINSRLYRLLIEKRDYNEISIYRKKYNFVYLNCFNKINIKKFKEIKNFDQKKILKKIFIAKYFKHIPSILNYFKIINEIYISTSLLIHSESTYYEIDDNNNNISYLCHNKDDIFNQTKTLIIDLLYYYQTNDFNNIVIFTEKILDILSLNKII